ncbi:MAG: hypothetical protein HFJ45_06470 [Clostridia bacterium]|nr:hypothetical protein [Clostridia bacterium]
MTKKLKRIIIMIIVFCVLMILNSKASYASSDEYYITVNYGANVVTIYSKDPNRKFYSSI